MPKVIEQNDFVDRFRHMTRKMVFLVCGLVLIFVVVQFVKLTTVGRLGGEISKVKSHQKQIELENELLRSQISELKSSSHIESSLDDYGIFVFKNSTKIELDTTMPEEIQASN